MIVSVALGIILALIIIAYRVEISIVIALAIPALIVIIALFVFGLWAHDNYRRSAQAKAEAERCERPWEKRDDTFPVGQIYRGELMDMEEIFEHYRREKNIEISQYWKETAYGRGVFTFYNFCSGQVDHQFLKEGDDGIHNIPIWLNKDDSRAIADQLPKDAMYFYRGYFYSTNEL